MIKKSLYSFVCYFLLTSCTTKTVKPAVEEPAPIAETQSKPFILKRFIKDIDLKKGKDDQSPKKRVAILPFLDRQPDRSEIVLKNAKNAFLDDLNKTNELIAIDSSELKIDDFSKFIKNNEYDMAGLIPAIQNSGVTTLLEAKVIDLRFKNSNSLSKTIDSLEGTNQMTAKKAAFEIVVKLKMVSVRTGQELFNTVKTVSIEEENTTLPENAASDVFFNRNPELVELLIKDAFLDFTPKLIESLNQVIWEGRIAALQGEKIYLNVGKVTGVQIGDILKVVEDGQEIYDPEVGHHIGKVPGKIKGTVEIVNFFGQDGAIGVIHSGAGFKENDRIELYE